MLALLLLASCTLLATAYSKVGVDRLAGNESEVLAFQALQAYASLPSLHSILSTELRSRVRVKAIPDLFAQQKGIKPADGETQLENFGAQLPWAEILRLLDASPDRRLLLMVRHGQAFENLNPTSNANCEFKLDGETVQNFDSPLTPEGKAQAASLNSLLRSASSQLPGNTWYKTIGITREMTSFVTSPLSRTMQTTEGVFVDIPLDASVEKAFQVHEMVRATIGRDVCNFRHSVKTPTSATVLPVPWQTGCILPSESLEQLYNSSAVKFSLSIRPQGGAGFGLVSDNDQLWRSDVADDEIIDTRATAFLSQLFAYTAPSSVTVVVTHGEFVGAVYKAAGQAEYGPKNTELVPLMLQFA